MKLEQEVKKLLATFRPVPVRKPRRKMTPCRLRVNGEFVQLRSGKSFWADIGHAKCAIRKHIRVRSYEICGDYPAQNRLEEYVIKELVGIGPDYLIQLVPTDAQ